MFSKCPEVLWGHPVGKYLTKCFENVWVLRFKNIAPYPYLSCNACLLRDVPACAGMCTLRFPTTKNCIIVAHAFTDTFSVYFAIRLGIVVRLWWPAFQYKHVDEDYIGWVFAWIWIRGSMSSCFFDDEVVINRVSKVVFLMVRFCSRVCFFRNRCLVDCFCVPFGTLLLKSRLFITFPKSHFPKTKTKI